MTRSSLEEKNKYSKRIEEIIEDAEIEAELEAEKKIRSKHTKLVSISAVGVALLVALYFGMRNQPDAPKTQDAQSSAAQVAEVAKAPEPKPIPFPLENKNAPLPPIQDKLNEAVTGAAPQTPVSPAGKTPQPADPTRMTNERQGGQSGPGQTAERSPSAKEPAPAKTGDASASIKNELEKLEKLSAPPAGSEKPKAPDADGKPLLKQKPKSTKAPGPASSRNGQKIARAPSKRTPIIKEDFKTDRMASAPTVANERNRAGSTSGRDDANKPNNTEEMIPAVNSETPINRQASVKLATPKEHSVYSIQLGVFSIKDNADRLSGKLKSKGFQPNVRVLSSYDVYHAVYVGGFPDKQSSEQEFKNLSSAGYHPLLEKNPDSSYAFFLAKFHSKKEAESLQSQLNRKGFLSRVQTSSAESKKYIVRVGEFASAQEARVTQEKLASEGFIKSLIKDNS
ncbi:MAG: SPOR domain-containing protein [Nitrospinae bacterium]|nr:SPOR domain-containing protein [Nitrospinota bacterium]